MATRDVFSEEEMGRLRSFPEIGRVELIRHFTLTDAVESFLRKFRTGRNVLGAADQLCALPWLGHVQDDVSSAPDAAVGRLSQRLGVPMGELRDYGTRSQTRTDHLRDRRLRGVAHHGRRRVEGTGRVSVRPGDGA